MWRSLLLLLLAFACSAAAPARPDTLDAAARDYVRLQLAVGQKEDGYIDAYYGPPAFEAQGKALARREDLPALQRRAEALRDRAFRLGSLGGVARISLPPS